MTKIRPLFMVPLMALPLLLSGCGTLSNLPPFSWFGGSLEVTDAGVGAINAGTPLSETTLDQALDGSYHLRGGMGTSNGKLTAFYEALQDNRVRLSVSGEPQGRVAQVEVLDKDIASAWGVKIGDRFDSLYSKAFGVCQPGQGDNAGSVECSAPQSKHVSYLFSGSWNGPEGLMPPDDILKNWQVSKLVWRAQARD